MNPRATVTEISPQHSVEICAAGKCSHAVSERIPCLCDRCDSESAAWTERQRRRLEIDQAQALSESTPRFRKRRFDTFDVTAENRAAHEAALQVARNPSSGIGIWGPGGVGKSHLAAAICNACTEAGIASCYVSVEELMARLRATFDKKLTDARNTEHAMMDRFATIPVLALDDLGKEPFTDWSVHILFALINRRYERDLPLIITANLDERAMMAHYSAIPKGGENTDIFKGSTMMDRLGEMTSSPWVQITGLSRRGVA